MGRRFQNFAVIGLVSSILAGCSTFEAKVPREVLEENPVSAPVRALTGFSDGLVCMGRMLKDKKVQTIYLTLADIPDYSEANGSAGFGAKEMLVSALSRMSEENGIVRFVAYDRRTPNIVALHNSHPKKKNLRVPDFFVRGAVTQINSSPFSHQKGNSLNLGEEALGDELDSFLGASLSNSNSISLKSVTLDLNLGLVSNYQILPGVTSSNTMSVMKTGDSTEFTVSFSKVGGIYSDNENRAGALSSALRSLVEVGLIELMGKLYNVPFEQCLAHLDQSSVARTAIRDQYKEMSDEERVKFIAYEMDRQGLIKMDENTIINGKASAEFQTQIAAFRVKNGLFPNTSVDYRLFEKAFIQSKQDVKDIQQGTGAGPLKRWLHVGKEQ
ncbi:hypothetical protein RYZ26_02445 [Terasakiella sp. A23]|uniref:hypothetical protein n=1 Tax=Terasakiella sp. FCG-A23 TaxID=3080561 RepID=UPI0029537D45|nr:hypothetical protein [Terasakiella sp. A23]MDV7338440.1 hypothetical protein [Terasakiella sp. A23]